MISRIRICLIFLLFFTYAHTAQTIDLYKNITNNNFNNLIYGNNYNNRITKNFHIPIINKDSLTYIKTLNFNNLNSFFVYKANSQNIYKFIPLNKALNEITPKLLYKTITNKTVDNLLSGQNIYSAVICNNLLTNFYPHLSKLKLCKINNTQNNNLIDYTLGYWSEYNQSEDLFLQDTINTSSLIYLINNNPSVKINYEEILKYRLIDILLGNTNVHPNNFWFVKTNNFVTPLVFPKQSAFPLFGGLFYIGAKLLVPSFISFNEDYKSPEATTWKSRYFDRRFLTQLNWNKWEQVINVIQQKLNDSLITASVKQDDIFLDDETKQFLINGLIKRKNELKDFSFSYYKLINKYAEIYCTTNKDSVIITRNANNTTKVYIKSQNNNSFYKYFERVFDNNITSEIRVFLDKGDDYCLINGKASSSPIIKVNGEEGKDTLIDNSYVDGYLFSFLPIKQSDYNTYFFDEDVDTEIIEGDGTVSNYKFFKDYVTYNEKYDTELKDYGHNWSFYPILELNTDEGLITGGGPELTKFNYGLLPYAYFMRLTGSYATQPKSYKISFLGDFKDVILNSSLLINITKAELSFDRYYGYGNETEFNYEKDKAGYYKSVYELFTVSLGIKKNLTKNTAIKFSILYDYGDIKLNNLNLLNDFKYNKYGIGSLWLMGGELCVNYDSRDNIDNTHKGLFAQIKAIYYPTIFKKLEFPFSKFDFDIRFFNKISGKYNTVIANKIGGAFLLGKYPFLKGAFIGGNESLRGYNKNRFAGDISLFSQNEIRTQISNLDIFVKSKIGLLLLGDIGRVFINNKKSFKWHPSAGFGTWIDFSDRLFTVVATLALSKEKPELFFGTNFSF
ncbi:MAG TPA: hypothetical protein PL041_03215 [Melioribacteraceae bacterium]|nr:hypothetical protein [Melioribacteraceae bacterium]